MQLSKSITADNDGVADESERQRPDSSAYVEDKQVHPPFIWAGADEKERREMRKKNRVP